MYINSMYKSLQHTYYRVCGSVTRDKAYGLINKLVRYEDGTLPTEVITIFKTVKKHQCCIWWGQTPCQTWKNSRSGKMATAVLNNIYWVPRGRDWLCTLMLQWQWILPHKHTLGGNMSSKTRILTDHFCEQNGSSTWNRLRKIEERSWGY